MNVTTLTPHAPPSDALDRALASLEWTLVASHRHQLASGEPFARRHAGPGFVYVFDGVARLTVQGAPSEDLSAGELVFFPRAHSTSVLATGDVEFIDVGFEAAPLAHAAAETLPAALVVRDFARQEPSMVALIDGMACAWGRDSESARRGGATGHPRAGDAVICSRIATTIVSTALRAWNEAGCAPAGWLRDVTEPRIAAALEALHQEPGRPWTLDDLARVARMSRSAFALRFQEAVGETPIGYLTRVRMETAKGLLLRSELTIGAVASGLGYESQAGFSRAFQRHTGSTPGRWRVEARSGAVQRGRASP
ncbi:MULTISPECIES: AraC family transcriptional regulator [unclassified Pseudoclavibacter]|uniref:AraC family transcriptional regulator n=1 Tax=unclassified Pseudoclavibacter TaxID=2615177 RepID=UPI001BAB8D65|nr:AraC family transcriptional regulator [Pseudoclavibacter sp. Marseille-Q4354]MBS3179002.1 helix-turn-helix domain-containing protein [Pseudoclavibacter sp. Marseille-Q4354]